MSPNWFDIAALLALPFAPEQVEVKPGATNQEKTQALALAYVDARHYQARLDATVGPSGWQVSYRPWGDRAVICTLTVLDVTREDVGEAEQGDPNQATSAAMQAFKRACAAFGLGRYLYTDLPMLWVPCQQRGRAVVITDQVGTVAQLYHSAGIDLGQRGRILVKLNTLLAGLSDTHLIEVGKAARAFVEAPNGVKEPAV